MDYCICLKCNLTFKWYWLKDGMCNGCRNPHLIVISQVDEDLDCTVPNCKTCLGEDV